LSKLSDRPSEANHAYVAVRTFFKWAARNDLIDRSPIEHMQLPFKLREKNRVLSPDELGKVWNATFKVGYPFGDIVRLLILTGQRRSEIGGLKWDWISDTTLTVPAHVAKNGRQHVIPIIPMIRDVIQGIPAFKSDFLFPHRWNPAKPYNGWSKSKRELDTSTPLEPWTLHDLRRSFATHLAALDTPIHVTERLLNHSTGTISGVAAVYNKYSYMDEMRTAHKAYHEFLLSSFSPEGVNRAGFAGGSKP
jgi:integrase